MAEESVGEGALPGGGVCLADVKGKPRCEKGKSIDKKRGGE